MNPVSHLADIPPLHGFPGGSVVKNPPAMQKNLASVPRLGRSPGKENGNPLQYSCQGKPVDREAWWAIAHGVGKNQTAKTKQQQTFLKGHE